MKVQPTVSEQGDGVDRKRLEIDLHRLRCARQDARVHLRELTARPRRKLDLAGALKDIRLEKCRSYLRDNPITPRSQLRLKSTSHAIFRRLSCPH